MKKDRAKLNQFKKLRSQAEKVLGGRLEEIKNVPGEDIQKLIHELEVHHIELEMQREELRKARAELEADASLAAVQPALQDTHSDRFYDAGFGRELATRRFYKAVFHGCSVMFRADTLRAAGGFPHLLLGGAEDFLSYRFYDMGYRVLYFPSVVVRHMMSPKERVLKHRLMYQSMQKLRAQVTHIPGIPRLLYAIIRGMAAYTFHNTRSGYWLFLPIGIWNHVWSVAAGLRERSPVSMQAMQLFNRLKEELVETEERFSRIDERYQG